MRKEIKKIVRDIENKSGRTLQNKELISNYIFEAMSEGKPVTFFNWECPPRRIGSTDGKFFIDYNVDLGKIFQGKKTDEYTELPRVVERSEEEIEMLSFMRSLGFTFRFVKIVADTNAFYITPESLSVSGRRTLRNKFREFKNFIKNETLVYPVKTEAVLFTDLIRQFVGVYEKIYKKSYRLLNVEPTSLLPLAIFREQLTRTEKHIGIKNGKWVRDFSIRTIATYAAEGVVFEKLSKTVGFSNCIWLNNHEIDKRTVEVTNCYRRKIGIGDLPMVLWGAGTP
ncbi:MAG: hypothetical protein Q7S86_03235 [bacterium]|nr:hypothetical protein [bacterium]